MLPTLNLYIPLYLPLMKRGIFISKFNRWHHFRKCLLGILTIGATSPLLRAQNTSSQMWYTYNQQAIVSKKWGYLFDINHRTASFKNTTPVLSAARAGATYLFDHNHRLSAGYAWFGSHIGDVKGKTLTENRLWEQYQVFKTSGKTSFFHRVRLEQRWRELLPQNGELKGETAFSIRARYMYQHQGAIWPISEKRKFGVGWQGGSEIMLHAGEGIEKHYFDQFRIVGGIVLMPSKSINLAVLYQYIHQYRPSTEQAYNIHTIRLTLLHQIDFSARKKPPGPRPSKEDE